MEFKKSGVIILKPTHRCNFNCVYCYDRFERSKSSAILPVDDLIMGINKISSFYNTLLIIWHGGEPTLLGVDYMRKVMTAFKDNSKITWAIQTNGSLIDDNFAQLFKEFNVDVGISYDGLLNNTTRQQIDIIKVRNTLEKYNVKFGLLMTVTPEVSVGLIPTYKYLHDENIDISFNHLFGDDVTKEQYSIIANNLIGLFDFICVNKDLKLIRPFDDILRAYTGDQTLLCETRWCQGKWLAIEPNGDIKPCGKPWSDDFIYGNIYNDELSADMLINSDAAKKVAMYKMNNLKHCMKCDLLRVCQNGCIFNSARENGKYYKFDDAYCYFFRLLYTGVINRLEARVNDHSLINTELISIITNQSNLLAKNCKNYKCI